MSWSLTFPFRPCPARPTPAPSRYCYYFRASPARCCSCASAARSCSCASPARLPRAYHRNRLALPGIAAERERLGLPPLTASAPRSLQCLPPRSPLPSLADKSPCLSVTHVGVTHPGVAHTDVSHTAVTHTGLQTTPTHSCDHLVATRRYRQVSASLTVGRAPTPPHLAASATCSAPAPHLRRSWEVGRTTPTPSPPIIRLAPTPTRCESVPTIGNA